MHSSRLKATYKPHSPNLLDAAAAQRARRAKFLEDQRRRRESKIEASRIESLTLLNLNIDDSDEDGPETPDVLRQGVAAFAPMLGSEAKSSSSSKKAGHKKHYRGKKSQKESTSTSTASTKQLHPSKWADKCMYAELLEMVVADPALDIQFDGLPEDLETAWIALAPVPKGKRCLAITYQSSGIHHQFPNTVLRSRVLGKPLISKFPSALPPSTILDCILDDNWRDNGILHILDVLKWNGQDVMDCETPFRFWWRDTRLSELPPRLPPPSALIRENTSSRHRFAHPTSFLPIPYHSDLSLKNLLQSIIPLSKSMRPVDVAFPYIPESTDPSEMDMMVDGGIGISQNPLQESHIPKNTVAEIRPDGLLLYVSEASYECGTTPLSSWIPIQDYGAPDNDDQMKHGGQEMHSPESPLEKFRRLVERRMDKQRAVGGVYTPPEVGMEMDA